MNNDRIEGAARNAKGFVKQKAGEATGNDRMAVEGAAERVAGKVQNTAGKIKDKLKD